MDMVGRRLIAEEVIKIDEFISNPVGRFIRRPSFVYWYPRRGLTTFSLVGRPTIKDIRDLNRVMDVVIQPKADIHLSLIDTSRLREVEDGAFDVMAAYLAARAPAFRQVIQQQAMVRPSAGRIGALVAGFYEVVTADYPVELFADLTSAVKWLGIVDPSDFGNVISELSAQVEEHEWVVKPLRELLDGTLSEGNDRIARNIRIAARKMGMPVRTMQRRLSACQTSFKAEFNAAQIRLAKRLMVETEATLSEIAIRIGCSTLQHLSSMFKKWTGHTPSEWRARNRGIGPGKGI